MPILNTHYISGTSTKLELLKLSELLKAKKQGERPKLSPTAATPVYIYKYSLQDSYIDPNYHMYRSQTRAAQALRMDRIRIRRYIDTYVPFRGLLVLSSAIKDFTWALSQTQNATKGLPQTTGLAKEVWVYSFTDTHVKLVDNKPFSSIYGAAEFLESHRLVVSRNMDTFGPKDFKGYHLFSKPIHEFEFITDMLETEAGKEGEYK